jgi:hypothetical protein
MLLEENVEHRREVLGPKHPDTLWSMCCLGITYHEFGRYADAGRVQAETLSMRRNVLGRDNVETIESMIALSLTYQALGLNQKAEELIVESEELARSRHAGLEHDQRKCLVHRALARGEPAVICRDFERLESR